MQNDRYPPHAGARIAGMPRRARWIAAARLRTLGLSVMPVIAGSWLAAAAGGWRPAAAAAALVAAVAIQIGTNLWNDAADAATGVDRADRIGPPRMTALGLLSAAEVRHGALAAFAVAAMAGLWLAAAGGWPVLAIGVAALGCGYLYSMGPAPLSGLPVGEVLVVLFFGLVAVSGTAMIQGGDPLAPRTLALGAMIGLPAAAVLLVNNHRDRVQDARAGRRTLAILIGEGASRVLYAALLAAAVGIAALLAPSAWLMLPAALAIRLVVAMWRWPVSGRLNALLGQTAGFQALLLCAVMIG